jgi:hypothetical protein
MPRNEVLNVFVFVCVCVCLGGCGLGTSQVEAFDISMCALDDMSPCPANAETKVDWIALSKA